MKRSKYLSTLSFFLIFAILITSLPVRALTISSAGITSSGNVSEISQSKDDVYIVEEDISKRGEFEKHFLCSDGSYVAVTYPNAVHFKNDDNEWQEFNHTLSLDTKTGTYKTSNDDFVVSFSENTSSNSLIRLQNESYEIAWTIKAGQGRAGVSTRATAINALDTISLSSSNIEISESNITEFASATDRLVSHQDAFAIPEYTSQVAYSDVFTGSNISLRYTVDANRVKEDIVINEKSDISSFVMDMQIGALAAVLNDDNSVSLIDRNGELQYSIGVPYLVDANYEYSYDVNVTIEQNGTSCKITYTPDRNWLNAAERAYPIVLDPWVTTNEYTSSVIDTFAWKNHYADQSHKAYLDVGVDSGDPTWAFIKCSLPNIDSSCTILSTKLTLSISKTVSYNYNTINIFASQPWSSLSALQPINSLLGSSKISFTAGSSGKRTLTIENNGPPNENGYILKFLTETNVGETNYVRFHSAEATGLSTRPYFTISYSFPAYTSLPSELIDNGVYAFKNVNTAKYMTVASNANNADFSQQSSTTPSKNQLFKIDLQSGTGGSLLRAMCSSDGTNRVVDVKTGGAIPVSGNSIQLYAAGGYPEAQEWLFVPLGNNQYKIILRSNNDLCITGTNSNDVVLQTYSGSSLQKWTMQFMGCKSYCEIIDGSAESESVNCIGYAFGTMDNPLGWLGYTEAQANSWANVNDALQKTKLRFENNWLDSVFHGKWEDVTNQGGINAPLAKNQWLVAMRVGIGDIFTDGIYAYYMESMTEMECKIDGVDCVKLITFDCHFWYRDDTGQWANKHGLEGGSERLGTDIPTTNNSPGWKYVWFDNYYNSNIVYYRITE